MVGEEVQKNIKLGLKPLSFLWTAFLFICGITLLAIVVFAITLFVYNGVKNGELKNAGLLIGIGAEKTDVTRVALSEGASWYDYIFNYKFIESKTSWTGDTTTTEEKLYFKIDEFIATPKTLEINTPIFARAIVKVTAPDKKDINIDLGTACSLDNYTGPIVIDKTERFVVGGTSDEFSVTCEFTNGLQERGVKKLRFMPTFAYEQEVTWFAEAKKEYTSEDERKNPTWNERIGPENIKVGSFDTQPFYENENHLLAIELTQNLGWSGYVKDIKDIIVQVPREIVLDTQKSNCHFQEQDGNYVVRYDALARYNQDCTSKETWIALGKVYQKYIDFDQCITYLKKQFEFTCPFKMYGLTTNAEQYPIKVKFKYEYQLSEVAGVTITDLSNV